MRTEEKEISMDNALLENAARVAFNRQGSHRTLHRLNAVYAEKSVHGEVVERRRATHRRQVGEKG